MLHNVKLIHHLHCQRLALNVQMETRNHGGAIQRCKLYDITPTHPQSNIQALRLLKCINNWLMWGRGDVRGCTDATSYYILRWQLMNCCLRCGHN